MVVCRYCLGCAGVVLLTALGGNELCAEEPTAESTALQPVTTDADPPATVIFEETVTEGYVFLDSEYLPLPYVVQATEDSVTVNGRPWPIGFNSRRGFNQDNLHADGEGRTHGGGRWRGETVGFQAMRPGGWGVSQRAAHFAARKLSEDLQMDCIMVAVTGQRPEIIQGPTAKHDFFVALLGRNGGADNDPDRLTVHTTEGDLDRWNGMLGAVTITPELRARAEEVVEEIDNIEAENFAAIRANHRLDTLAYPLTVLGMMLGVVALGHLLKSFSRLDAGTDHLLSPEARRATLVSIGLVVALSLFDLTWTILASQAGQMRELNPLGSRFISDPAMLIGFKLMATLVGCGLLFALRRHQRARQACWWLCLLCTVLTFRWIMFNSMFVA